MSGEQWETVQTMKSTSNSVNSAVIITQYHIIGDIEDKPFFNRLTRTEPKRTQDKMMHTNTHPLVLSNGYSFRSFPS